MIDWVIENLVSIIIVLVIAVFAVLAVVSIVRNRRKGKMAAYIRGAAPRPEEMIRKNKTDTLIFKFVVKELLV